MKKVSSSLNSPSFASLFSFYLKATTPNTPTITTSTAGCVVISLLYTYAGSSFNYLVHYEFFLFNYPPHNSPLIRICVFITRLLNWGWVEHFRIPGLKIIFKYLTNRGILITLYWISPDSLWHCRSRILTNIVCSTTPQPTDATEQSKLTLRRRKRKGTKEVFRESFYPEDPIDGKTGNTATL